MRARTGKRKMGRIWLVHMEGEGAIEGAAIASDANARPPALRSTATRASSTPPHHKE